MAKAKSTIFFCKECGHESAKWLGQCPGCKEWNTFVEAPAAPKSTAHVGIGVGSTARMGAGTTGNRGGAKGTPGMTGGFIPGLAEVKPQTLKEIAADTASRCQTGFKELDRVLGGGIVAGSLVLVGGDPGIGKSTLLLQMCKSIHLDGGQILYAESAFYRKNYRIISMFSVLFISVMAFSFTDNIASLMLFIMYFTFNILNDV